MTEGVVERSLLPVPKHGRNSQARRPRISRNRPYFGKPESFNTDQGSLFTSEAFTGLLKQHDIMISMDRKGAWRDNVIIERF